MVISDFALFLASVMVISLSGILLPGPLFAVTLDKSSRRRSAGVLISLGHGLVEVPLMLLIFFVLNEFALPWTVQAVVSLIGGLLMMYLGMQTYLRRNQVATTAVESMQDSLLAGVWTTAANPGFILWWLTVGTALIMNAKLFGFTGFCIFAGVHWMCDFVWYTIIAVLIFKSYKFWTPKIHQTITFFCVTILTGFGAWFFTSAIWQIINAI
ncbi:MAG: LysE family translocator [Candidatus Bathyarchaeota archaeon]|nr:LysE family translocator [Candidatus Bathyarchaeota archaeon]